VQRIFDADGVKNLLFILTLKEKVDSQLLVFITGQIDLDGFIKGKSQTTQL
jgi:hypothetical protein